MELLLAFLLQFIVFIVLGAVVYLMFGPERDWDLFSTGRGDDHHEPVVDRQGVLYQMRSSSHAMAREAVNVARENGWLSDGTLTNANLRLANLQNADISGADLRGANLHYANLAHANLRGANLSQADLGEANLRGADLRQVDLRGANLFEATLVDANLAGARADAQTRWPQEFDAAAAGVVSAEIEAPQT